MDIVKKYEQDVLRKFLLSYEIPVTVVDSISEDINTRLYSLLSIWNDNENRRAILTIGLEEATHYEPFNASLEIKALVVVAIRNSEFENLVSTNEALTKYGFDKPPLPEKAVKELTSSSVQFFNDIDLNSIPFVCDLKDESNLYLNLLNNYPLTSTALRKLGSWSNKSIGYPKVNLGNETKREIIDFSKSHDNIVNDNGVYVESGMEPSFSIELLKMLQTLSHQELPLMFNDSFKSTTRNIEKLFQLIEYVLDIDGVFLTNNFLILNGYVSKRKDLLRPMHDNSDFKKNLNNTHGLNKTHLKLLKVVQTKVLQN